MNNKVCRLLLSVSVTAFLNLLGQPPPIRIMPLGDSITYGSGGTGGGYRLSLYTALTNAGYNVDYVGTVTANSAPGLGAEVNHEGHGGWKITNPLNGLYDFVYDWFEAIEDPHVILLHIGTNDSGGFNSNTNDVNNLDRLITRLAVCQPSAHIIVTSLMKRGEPNYTAITNYFNPYVPGKVAGQQALGRRVTFLDMHAYVELSDMPDSLHPNDDGYAKMGAAWFPAITNVIGTNAVANRPAPIRAVQQNNQTNVVITFNKRLSAASATDTANYTANNGLSILSAALSANQRSVTLTTSQQQGGTNYTITANNIQDETAPTPLTVPADSQVSFTAYKPPMPRGYWNYVPESAHYALVYSLDLATTPNYSVTVPYSVDNSATVGGFDRVAYYLELQKSGADLQYVWVSMDAFTNRADKLGIPNLPSGALYQRYVNNLFVACNVSGVSTGTVSSGNIEFWPYNYSAGNALGIPNADGTLYDFGDLCSFNNNYSCMQVHNYQAGHTIFALNHWNSGGTLEAGIGSNPNASSTGSGGQRDWTFTNNGGEYTIKTLQVLVRRDRSDTTPPQALRAWADTSRRLVYVTFSETLNASSITATRFALNGSVNVLGATLQSDLCTVALTTTLLPLNTPLTLSISGVRDASPNVNVIAPGTTVPVAAPSLPAEIVSNVGTNSGDMAAGFDLVYTLDIPVTGKFVSTPNPYRYNRSDAFGAFDRVAYYAELVTTSGTTQYLWAAMDAFTTDRKKIGVPTAASGAVWQREVANLDVKSNVAGVNNGSFAVGGNLEFWPNDYGSSNALPVAGASHSTFDFGDERRTTGSHGSMQIHNYLAGQTLFAMSNWGADNNTLGLGIGNCPSPVSGGVDWTFAANAGTAYTRRTLHVLVRPTPFALPAAVAANVPDSAGYQLAYTISLPVTGDFWGSSPVHYTVNNFTNGLASTFSRVAYYLELQSGSSPTQWVWTAMDAFTTDARKIGVPTNTCAFQTRVTRLDVRSNVDGIVTGNNFDTGNIEIWPSNYGGGNSLPVPNAHNVNFDFGDGGFSATTRGYGSMQVHNHGASATQTLFAVNNFNNNATLCIGIGNCPNPALSGSSYGVDWTFKNNAGTYNYRRLHVFVLPSAATDDITRPTLLNANASLSLNEVAVGFSETLAESSASTGNFALSGGATVTAARLSPGRRDVILTTSPLTAGQAYTVTVNGVADAAPLGNLIAPNTTASFVVPVPRAADVLANVAESADYELVAYLAVSNNTQYANGAQYLFDESRFQRVQPFDRVAYCMELVTNGVTKWVYVSMDAFTNDLAMIGVPTADRADPFIQTYVSNLNVYAYASDGDVAVTTGVGIAAGNIEFWSSNYGAGNARSIPGASASLYDFGDDRGSNRGAGHGSMQVHNYLQGHTIFSMASFGSNGRNPGLGIGNKPNAGNDPDWTFTYNATTYSTKNIYVLARRGLPGATSGTRPDLWHQPRAQTVHVGDPVLFSVYSPNATAYQWRKNGVGIPGATQSWLEISPANAEDSGVYDVLVYGSSTTYVLSEPAPLAVILRGTLIRLK